MVVIYLANARLPTEKANGLQIVENCDALARAGARVTLVVPRRAGTRRSADDVRTHYGLRPTFTLRFVPCVDLFPLGRWCAGIAARVLLLTFTLAALFALRRETADVYFSRDPLPLLLLGFIRPRAALAYEAHTLAPGGPGRWLQRACVRRVGTVVAMTDRLAADLQRGGAGEVVVLRDGYRVERFADLPSRDEARAAVGVPRDVFCAGYLGQLETLGASKGLELVVDAIARLRDPRLHLCLAGGPGNPAAALRARWQDAGLRPDAFHWLGDRPPSEAARLLPAFDACLLPLPATPHFALYASPLKLFEYMAAGRPIVAAALPSIAEVVTSGESALLVPAGDAAALARAIADLRDDPSLGVRLGAVARNAARAFTWDVRARKLLTVLAGRPAARIARPSA